MLRCFVATAWHGGYLCLNPETGLLASARQNAAFLRYPPVLAHIAEDRGTIAALLPLTEPDATIAIPPHEYCNAILPVRVTWRDDRRVAFLHPLSLRYVSIAPLPPEEPLGTAAADADTIGERETFDLFEAPESLVMQPVLARLEAVAPLLGAPHEAATIIRHIERSDTADAGFVLDALLPLLPLAELEQLASAMLDDPRLAARLAAMMPDDIWAAEGLPSLREWLARRIASPEDEYPRKLGIPARLDVLANAGLGHHVSLGHACNALARRAVRPRRALCVIAAARNEGIYLLEWIAYHRGIGVEEFFLYSNDNADDSDVLLSVLADAGVVVWIDNRTEPGVTATAKAYAHALNLLPGVLDYRWALLLDLDEFLVLDPVRFGSAVDFASWHELRATDAIALERIEIGSGGERGWRDQPVIRRFRHALPSRPASRRAMFRPGQFIHATPESPRADERHAPAFRNANGDRLPPGAAGRAAGPAAPASATEFACVYHYPFKSAGEYLWKLSRKRGQDDVIDATEKELLRQFVAQHGATEVAVDDRIDRCAPNLESEIAWLRSLDGVAEADARVRQAYRKRIELIKRAYASIPSGVDLD